MTCGALLPLRSNQQTAISNQSEKERINAEFAEALSSPRKKSTPAGCLAGVAEFGTGEQRLAGRWGTTGDRSIGGNYWDGQSAVQAGE